MPNSFLNQKSTLFHGITRKEKRDKSLKSLQNLVLKVTFIPGVSFQTSLESLIDQIPRAVSVFAEGVDDFLADTSNVNISLIPHLSCQVLFPSCLISLVMNNFYFGNNYAEKPHSDILTL